MAFNTQSNRSTMQQAVAIQNSASPQMTPAVDIAGMENATCMRVSGCDLREVRRFFLAEKGRK